MAGVPAALELNGKSYRLSPLRLADLVECEQHILSQRGNPFNVVRDGLANAPTPEGRTWLHLPAFQAAYRLTRPTGETRPASLPGLLL